MKNRTEKEIGEEALRRAMWNEGHANNDVTRYISDAVAKKLVRGESGTNADRVRVMTNDALARTLICPNDAGLDEIPCDKSDGCDCYACLLRWLAEPARDET